MIFVIIGTHHLGFPRLIKELDRIAKNIDSEIIAQIGYGKYIPKNLKYFRFLDEGEFNDFFKKADTIVCHGGASVIDALLLGKPVVSVPRLSKYGEHSNDHQLEFSRKMEEAGFIKVVENIEDLESAIKNSKPLKKAKKGLKLNAFLKGYIDSLSKSKGK